MKNKFWLSCTKDKSSTLKTCVTTAFEHCGSATSDNDKINKNNIGRNKILVSIAVVLAFFYSIFLGKVYAAIGVCNIANPSNRSRLSGTTYCKVYFGTAGSTSNYQSNSSIKGQPIWWRVLNTKSNGYTSTSYTEGTVYRPTGTKPDALFMLTEYCIVTSRAWASSGQEWSNSTLRTFLSGTVLSNCFTGGEQGVIMKTWTGEGGSNKAAKKWDGSTYWACKNAVGGSNGTQVTSNNLTGEKLFLLSAEEVVSTDYGFDPATNTSSPTADVNRVAKFYATASSNCDWWLRSAYSSDANHIAIINAGGGCNGYHSNGTMAVRFALNIPLSTIIHTPLASASSANASAFATITPIAAPATTPDPSKSYKLTIVDTTSSGFGITQSSVTVPVGGTVYLNYTGANTGAGKYICAIIKKSDSAGYWGKFKPEGSSASDARVVSANGQIKVTLPTSGLTAGSTYDMIVYNETDNGACKTNLAKYDVVKLNIDTPPKITQVYKNSSNTAFRVTASDNIALLKIADSTNGNTKYADMSGTSFTTNFTRSSAISAFRVYDNNSLYTQYTIASSSPSAISDTTSPTGSVTYTGLGNYTITAQKSTGSGLWKVMIGDTVIIDGTKGSTKYPTSQQTYNGTGPISGSSAIVYDGVNNQYSISLDNVAPTYITPTYSQGIYTIKVTDSVSGLWKIADTTGSPLAAVNGGHSGDYSSNYPTDEQTYVGQGPVAQIRLYDKAGNWRTVDLDNTAPNVVRACRSTDTGKVIIEVSDSESGLWKITNSIEGDALEIDNDTVGELFGTSQIKIFTYTSNDPLYVYDHAGNYREITFTTDNEGPTKTVSTPTYSQGTYTINVSDSESGLWKVADTTGSPLSAASGGHNGDYSGSSDNYPKTQQTFTGQGPVAQIKLYDAVENITTVDLDHTMPTASGFWNGSNIKVTAQDSGSGLWKIATSSGGSDISSSNFTGTGSKTEVISSSVRKVWVYDHAGNCNELDLVEDKTPPTYSVAYDQGTTTITVTDGEGSGVAKIGETSYSEYPATQSQTVPIGVTSLTIEDALGNSDTAVVDRTGPTINRAYKNENHVVIDATDTAGLWKITTAIGGNAIDGVSISGTSDIAKFTTSSTVLYIYDQAGNYTKKNITAPANNEVTTTSVQSVEGTTTANFSSLVGIWKITDASDNILSATTYNGQALYDGTVLQNASLGKYPTSVQYKKDGPIGFNTIRVYDAIGRMTEVSLDNTAPHKERAYKNGTDAVIEATDSGCGLWKITETVSGEEVQKSLLSGSRGIAIIQLSDAETTQVKVYDQAGNYNTFDLDVDDSGPSFVGPTYSGGTITLSVTDDESGLYSITPNEGSAVTYATYPQDAQSYTVATGTRTVTLTDVLGNPTVVDIDYTQPSVNNVYANKDGNFFRLTMTDNQAGLDKIMTSNGVTSLKDISTIGTNTKTINFSTTGIVNDKITSFNVYDQAGNVNEITSNDIITDEAEPNVTSVVYSKGDCTVTVQDIESGIWKIVDGTSGSIIVDCSTDPN